jgi:serine/threonine protein kinase/Flp pilus assembly protein TadD
VSAILPERFREADAVFDAALDLAREERDRYVERACGVDGELCALVKRLLRAHERADEFLATPASEMAAPLLTDLASPPASAMAERVGAYRIVREIGRGGMGAVYLAERDDGQFRQRAALKVARSGIGTDYLLRRFIEERQILASLEHPYVARLLDGGVSADGVPWFAMEYVEGQPIDRYCDARRLTIEQRLKLFLDVCEAVQYAHRNLVIHRDLKPSNILVTADGGLKLLDFGIAKLLAPDHAAEAEATATGLRMMTPAYASPEQIRGDAVTIASDVYALGVLLYELVAGRHPFRAPGLTTAELERRILEEQPERPSAMVTRAPGDALAVARGTSANRLSRRLRGDLDAIILKALEKGPERRYATADQLGTDVRRHLFSLPIAARPDTWAYRASRLIRRNRVAATAGGAFVLLLAASSAVTTVQSSRIRAQAERLARENEKTDQVAAFLAGLFAVSDPDSARGQVVTARELLDRGAARMDRELANQPDVRARMLDAMGVAYGGLGIYDRAKPLLERALVIRRRLHDGDHPDLAASIYNLATILRFRGEFEPAEALFRDALAMRRRLFGDQHQIVVESLNGLGFVLRGRGADAEAESVYREALATAKAAYGGPHLEIAVTLNGLGTTLSDQGRFEDAVKAYREALAMHRALGGEDHPETGVVLLNLGRALDRKGDREEAEAFFRQSVAVSGRVQGDRHPVYALNLTLLADLLRRQGELAEAETLYRRALEIQRGVLPPRHANTASTLLGIGRLLMDRGRYREAEPLLREALAIREHALVANHWGTALARSALGACLSRLGRYEEAEPLLLDGYTRLRDAVGMADARTQRALAHLVDHLERTGRPADAAGYRSALQSPLAGGPR